jgi:hypothetical protein
MRYVNCPNGGEKTKSTHCMVTPAGRKGSQSGEEYQPLAWLSSESYNTCHRGASFLPAGHLVVLDARRLLGVLGRRELEAVSAVDRRVWRKTFAHFASLARSPLTSTRRRLKPRRREQMGFSAYIVLVLF